MELNGSGVFLPKRILGILENSRSKQAAEAFLVEMLSAKAQERDYDNGFPVNCAVMEKAITEERVIDSWTGYMDENGNDVGFQAQYPKREDREKLRSWVENLTTPAQTDLTIRNMVMQQLDTCLDSGVSPEAAAKEAVRMLNMYLAE